MQSLLTTTATSARQRQKGKAISVCSFFSYHSSGFGYQYLWWPNALSLTLDIHEQRNRLRLKANCRWWWWSVPKNEVWLWTNFQIAHIYTHRNVAHTIGQHHLLLINCVFEHLAWIQATLMLRAEISHPSTHTNHSKIKTNNKLKKKRTQ